jgi:hypothetical protein
VIEKSASSRAYGDPPKPEKADERHLIHYSSAITIFNAMRH